MTTLIVSVIFGSAGCGYFIYGKKQQKLVPLLCGMALLVLPYLVTQPFALVACASGVAAAPWFFRE